MKVQTKGLVFVLVFGLCLGLLLGWLLLRTEWKRANARIAEAHALQRQAEERMSYVRDCEQEKAKQEDILDTIIEWRLNK